MSFHGLVACRVGQSVKFCGAHTALTSRSCGPCQAPRKGESAGRSICDRPQKRSGRPSFAAVLHRRGILGVFSDCAHIKIIKYESKTNSKNKNRNRNQDHDNDSHDGSSSSSSRSSKNNSNTEASISRPG